MKARALFILLGVLIFAPGAKGQFSFAPAPMQWPAYQINYGPVLPAYCNPLTGDVFVLNAGPTAAFYRCSAASVWSRVFENGADVLLVNGAATINGTLAVNATTADAINFTMTGQENLGEWRRTDAGDLHWHVQNLATGFTDADGTILGLETSGDFRIMQLENLRIEFYTNGVHVFHIDETGGVTWTGVPFASLAGAPGPDGTVYYCTDCAINAVCAGAGTGAFAKRLNGAWKCN